jgi:hypothetical protein
MDGGRVGSCASLGIDPRTKYRRRGAYSSRAGPLCFVQKLRTV